MPRQRNPWNATDQKALGSPCPQCHAKVGVKCQIGESDWEHAERWSTHLKRIESANRRRGDRIPGPAELLHTTVGVLFRTPDGRIWDKGTPREGVDVPIVFGEFGRIVNGPYHLLGRGCQSEGGDSFSNAPGPAGTYIKPEDRKINRD